MSEPMISFVPATRESVYFRGCAHGPGGAGKTYTGLLAMHVLCKGERFAVIDTERGRSRKYVGVNGWQFDIWEPHTFSPASLTEALGIAAGAGLPGVVIDSGSLFWNGAEGMTEQVDKFASSSGRNDKFGGWKEMAPIERRMWDAVLTYPGHIWMTLRVTSHYVVEERQRGDRTVATPRKVGLKPVQREGFDYEFDLVGAMDQDNGLLVTKSDILTIPQGTFIDKPGVEFAEAIGQFCAEGVETTGVMTYRSLGLAPNATVDGLKDLHGEVSRAGLVNAPVTDEFGKPTVLGDLLRQRAVALTTAARAAAKALAETQVAAAPTTPTAAPTPPTSVAVPAPATAPAVEPVTMAPAPQLTQIAAMMNGLGVPNEFKLVVANALANRPDDNPLRQAKDLTLVEANTVIVELGAQGATELVASVIAQARQASVEAEAAA